MNFTFLLVNFNNSNVTINCIESILANEYDKKNNVKIYIIDNNSIAEEKKILLDWNIANPSLQVSILYNASNLGYFKAFNEAIKLLTNKDKRGYIIIGNNDLYFDKYFIANLSNTSYNNDIYVISPNIINKDGIHQNPHLISRYKNIRLFYHYLYNNNYIFAVILNYLSSLFSIRSTIKDKSGYNQSQYITMGFGACYILCPIFFLNNNELDDYLFLMGEEGMLANQVLKSGGRTYYDSNLIVKHEDHATFISLPKYQTYIYNKKSYKISRSHYSFKDLADPFL